MKDILQKLIEIPSTTANKDANKAALDYIDQFLSERGMHVTRPKHEDVESLIATTQETKTPKVLLAAHVDVVHGPAELFKFREENGRYHGRGAADMKFAIAAYLQFIDDIKDSLADYDLGIMITTDEEIGGFHGTRSLIKDGYIPGLVLLPDMGDTPDNWKLERAAKGRIALSISADGVSAHGGRPWLGENAIDKLTTALDEMKSHFPNQSPTTNTFVVTVVEGGEAFNQIPHHARALVDIRFMTNDDSTTIMKTVESIAKKHGVNATSSEESYCSACKTDLTDPLVAKFIDCLKNVTNEKLDIVDSTAGSDARYFAEVGVPYIVAGPPANGCHANDEWVSAKGLDQFLKVLHCYVDQTAKL